MRLSPRVSRTSVPATTVTGPNARAHCAAPPSWVEGTCCKRVSLSVARLAATDEKLCLYPSFIPCKRKRNRPGCGVVPICAYRIFSISEPHSSSPAFRCCELRSKDFPARKLHRLNLGRAALPAGRSGSCTFAGISTGPRASGAVNTYPPVRKASLHPAAPSPGRPGQSPLTIDVFSCAPVRLSAYCRVSPGETGITSITPQSHSSHKGPKRLHASPRLHE